MVGAPGYDSGKSVLVIIQPHSSHISIDEVEAVWDVFEKNGLLVTFATSSNASALPLLQSGDTSELEEGLKERLEVPVNLSNALGFRGVSYDAFLVLAGAGHQGSEQRVDEKDQCRIAEILSNAVKGNKYIATAGDGVLALSSVSFRGKPVLKGKRVSSSSALADHLNQTGAQTIVSKTVTRDARLLTCADPENYRHTEFLSRQDLRAMCASLLKILQDDDGAAYIPAYLQ